MTDCNGPNKNPIGGSTTNMCKFKCNISFSYPLTSIIARKKKKYIELTSSDTSKPNVTFNNIKYTSQNILLFNTPIHNYLDGGSIVAELVIVHHKENSSNEKLYICFSLRYC